MKKQKNIHRLKCACSAFVAFLFLSPMLSGEQDGKIQILLLGDSTTEGYVPRLVQPEGPHVEQVLEQILIAEGNLPPCQVLTSGKGGETIRSLIDGGRYQRDVSALPGLDYIFIRYGINDSAQPDFVHQFPENYQELINLLRKDHPQAMIIPTTSIPFVNEWGDGRINDLIKQAASQKDLEVFDLYSSYAAALKKSGPHSLNYRRYPLSQIPEAYHEMLKSKVHGDRVVVLDNEFDALFGDLPGWYDDHHPNLAGYNVIAVETAKYLTPILKAAHE